MNKLLSTTAMALVLGVSGVASADEALPYSYIISQDSAGLVSGGHKQHKVDEVAPTATEETYSVISPVVRGVGESHANVTITSTGGDYQGHGGLVIYNQHLDLFTNLSLVCGMSSLGEPVNTPEDPQDPPEYDDEDDANDDNDSTDNGHTPHAKHIKHKNGENHSEDKHPKHVKHNT